MNFIMQGKCQNNFSNTPSYTRTKEERDIIGQSESSNILIFHTCSETGQYALSKHHQVVLTARLCLLL